jgi:hypothetical protein
VPIVFFRKTNGFAAQTFQMRAKIQILPFNLLRFLLGNRMLFGGNILLVSLPTVCIVMIYT